jgi:hypothetical protein
MVDDQVCSIALDTITCTDLNHSPPTHSDQTKEEKQNPIFAVLGKQTELHISERRQFSSIACRAAPLGLQEQLLSSSHGRLRILVA